MLLDYRITHRGSSAGGVAANEVQCASAVHNKEDTHHNRVCCVLAQEFCNSYSALSVRYGSNTARGPRAQSALGPRAVFEAIPHTKRTITIIIYTPLLWLRKRGV